MAIMYGRHVDEWLMSVTWLWWWVHNPARIITLYRIHTHTHTANWGNLRRMGSFINVNILVLIIYYHFDSIFDNILSFCKMLPLGKLGKWHMESLLFLMTAWESTIISIKMSIIKKKKKSDPKESLFSLQSQVIPAESWYVCIMLMKKKKKNVEEPNAFILKRRKQVHQVSTYPSP